jgi:hypothetical protein
MDQVRLLLSRMIQQRVVHVELVDLVVVADQAVLVKKITLFLEILAPMEVLYSLGITSETFQ